ncbi:MAG: hypothetical protein H6920_11585 [Sphingomonadaceae bacterium]|jgi:hypothetical protein|nr:hypothetical protein [Sphingomonadaceae bacterium]MCB2086538.1 hypothetical protein [Sphingomonadaceae bacterium]MCP5383384.1 hypothetical protein [Altererythrobacter sp.]MCP5392249.1 hypothetical protein [Sphingomonadaceae bacterium]MCP5393561.1 hypothetical protein [Sphingomonadaceae bacterium]
MSKSVNTNDGRKAWQKPAVRSITPVKRTAGGAVSRTTEDPFYNPS